MKTGRMIGIRRRRVLCDHAKESKFEALLLNPCCLTIALLETRVKFISVEPLVAAFWVHNLPVTDSSHFFP